MKYLRTFLTDLYLSFKTGPAGFSARKLTAFAAVVVAAFTTYKHTNDANATTMVSVWLLGAFLCLGIVTMEQITNLKNGKQTGSTT